ncbi:MAG: ATP-dependent Clp protease adaptor ClpS [Bacteroidetes bacterium]|nr:ATP-dependent Clp protease adaptor ClpS [Bacteroidota bacterium]
MEIPGKEIPGIEIVEEEDVSIGLKSKVILYNDDWHSFDEVILQIIKAIKCSNTEARNKAFETHVKGKSVIFNGEFKECLSVSSVLEEIALHTQIVT